MTDTPAFAAPDISGPIAAHITRLQGAIVVPPAKGLGNQSVQKSGVLTADGEYVENSITWRGRNPVTIRPAMPAAGEILDLPGRYMFLGPLFGHFGHFLVESICRIWAFDSLRDQIDGVITVPKFQNRPEHVAAVYGPFLEALGVTAPLHNLADPTRVAELYVPRQGFGMFQMIEGAPEFRDFVRAYSGKAIAPQGAEKIYISRSALPAIRGSVIGEKRLEAYLEAEGYTVFHPQLHSFDAQIAAYKAATHIIGVDCSPLHLLALVGHAGQKVGVIARRDGDLDQIFARQIRAFQGAEAHAVNVLERNWIEGHANRPSRTSWGQISFARLHAALHGAGLIAGATPWPDLDSATLAAEVAAIGEATKTVFKPYEGPAGSAPALDD
ncbi:MAG: glycosyltransferase family 61 protein [Rhodobacterales bacterium]|nr:glycosyltransferase family 61 protein [Rhodobacterales bacterium]NCT12783.1 glycosyltransferase family 61 protein [Rhodobacterales bacterium]